MNDYEDRLQDVLENVKVIDPHCHLNIVNPVSSNLSDILQYHHLWIELISSGMGQKEVTKSGLPQELQDPEIPPFERARKALPYLANVKNTTIGLFFRWILEDLYGVEGLNEHNLEKVWALVEKKSKDKGWVEQLLRDICHIDYSISVEYKGTPANSRLLKGRELYAINLISGKEDPAKILSNWEEYYGHEITNARSYRDFLEKLVDSISRDNFKFLGLWVLPNILHHKLDDRVIDSILAKIKSKEDVNEDDYGKFCFFGVSTLLDILRKTSLRVIQLIVGAEVLPPHRSITHWNGNFSGSIARIAGANEDFHFNISSAADIYTQDLGILAKHVANISVAGYWWHTLYPYYMKKSLETRLDMVPLNKIICYFSDAYHAEWCYPKLKIVKQILKEILIERIQNKWWSLDVACNVVMAIFHDNARRIYNI